MDEELLEAENTKLRNQIKECKSEIDFAVRFAEANGAITLAILKAIKSKLD